MQQPAHQQTDLDKSQGQVPLNQPIMAMPATGQPVMAAPHPSQPVMAAPATSQPIMYQTLPGQPQPMFVQAAPGQPAMLSQGQSVMAPPHPGQPVMAAPHPNQPVMAAPYPGQPYMAAPVTNQPIMYQMPPGQPQPMLVQAAPGQPAMSQDPDMAAIRINKAYMKSGLGVSRTGEFFGLLVAGICIIIYSNGKFNLDERVNFFKGIIIFCWVMVIIYQIIYMFGLNNNKNCFGRPSNFTIMSIAFQVLLTILLISCTARLTVRATELPSELIKIKYTYSSSRLGKKTRDDEKDFNARLIYASTALGYLACLDFLYDIYCLVIMYQQQRAQEAGGGTVHPAQQPGIIQQQQIGVAAQPPFLPQVTQWGTQQVVHEL